MLNWIRGLLERTTNYAPHGYCLLWNPELIWMHLISDLIVGLAYFSIPFVLVRYIRAKPGTKFGWLFWMFALFISFCGITHFMNMWTLFYPAYYTQGVLKVLTALASIATAVALWPLLPKAIALPGPTDLHNKNLELGEALRRLQFEIDERKRAEEALRQSQKMEAVGQLTGGIAHDFNNLLQSLQGCLLLISRNPESPNMQHWIELGLKAAEKGAKLTGQLLAFSRTQKLELKPTLFDDTVRGVSELVRTSVNHGVHVQFDLQADGTVVLGNPTQIELALVNLVINARDASLDGGTVKVTTRVQAMDGDAEVPDGKYLCLCVSDTGTGISNDNLPRVFEPFFTTKPVGQGTGLGLSMVYAVAKQTGGKVTAASEVGVGTTICMYFPVSNATVEDKPNEAALVVGRSLNILVVDDDDDVRTITSSLLESMGHHVQEAASGKQALAMVGDHDLIILDYAMPEMNGAEVANELKRTGVQIPVLFASGFADTEALKQTAGDAPVLQKPFSLVELAKCINDLVPQTTA